MVKKVIVIACLTASLLIFLDTINIGHSILMFLLAGIIPGTSIILTPNQMIMLMIALTGISVILISAVSLRSKIVKLLQVSKKSNKKQPARRHRLNQA